MGKWGNGEMEKWGNGEAVSSPYHPKTLSPQNPITLSPYLLLPPADRLLDNLKKNVTKCEV
ncbi:hypothetical protein [Microcystis aeruginosa]|uniref:hypothetical protein n=1 Tax=Microcystis aeruginosa TaxID=1126 RepID=UPI00129359A0|nr:hypothetical protein [Microcystis aeruginosa]